LRISQAWQSNSSHGDFSFRAFCFLATAWPATGGVVNEDLFSKEILPIAAVMACLFDFVVRFAVVSLFLAIARVGWSFYLLWTPVPLFTMLMMTIGIGMVVSAMSLFFRDVKYIVEVLLTFGISFAPLFFDPRMFGNDAKWFLFNPVASILDGSSARIMRRRAPGLSRFGYSLTFSMAVAIAGRPLFKCLEPAFAESN
jgi:lipopolysaccharide transport system permease protein